MKPEDLIEETIDGHIQFHSQYWKTVSESAKDFIRDLTKLEPHKRPTATQALEHPWLQTAASDVHHLDGLRESFSPRGRWRYAIGAVIATERWKALGKIRHQSDLEREKTKESLETVDSGEWGPENREDSMIGSMIGKPISRTTSDEEEDGMLAVRSHKHGHGHGSGHGEGVGTGETGVGHIPLEEKVTGQTIHEEHAYAIPDHAGEIE